MFGPAYIIYNVGAFAVRLRFDVDTTPLTMEPQHKRAQFKQTSLEELQTLVPEKLQTYQPTDHKDPKLEYTAPHLQALFEHAPTPAGRQTVGAEILSCATNECLERLSQRYWNGLIRGIRATGGKTPPISDHPSRPSADIGDIMHAFLLEPNNRDRREIRELVLRREDYRCAVTGACDLRSAAAGKTTYEVPSFSSVEVAHILPFSLVPSSTDPNAVERSGMVWEILNAFSGIRLDELNGSKINRPENGIALSTMAHQEFDSLCLCFEPTDTVNTYKVLRWKAATLLPVPDTITFVSRGDVPLPDPRYLAVHAACAKVVHQSGMAEIIDELINELEQTPVLSSDGSSAHLLHHALNVIWVQ